MNLSIVLPQGAMGASEHDDPLDATLRAIATHFAQEGEWADKYGTNVETPVFMMHRYCWCEGPDCPWCWDESDRGPRAPNFHYKPTGFKVDWYKYIGRSMSANATLTTQECARMLADCIASKPIAQP